jgi:hypothetical protein
MNNARVTRHGIGSASGDTQNLRVRSGGVEAKGDPDTLRGRNWTAAQQDVGFLCVVALLVTCAAFLSLMSLAETAQAFTIYSYSATPSTTQAGGHPNITFSFALEDYSDDAGYPNPSVPCDCNNAENLDVHLPAGVIGNPHATPQCSAADFIREECPADSRIGTAFPTVDFEGYFPFGPLTTPVYNLVPKPNQAGAYGWLTPLFNTPVFTVLSARTGTDYGLDASTNGIEQLLPLISYTQEVWGVPAEHYASNSPPVPFLQNPTSCSGPLSSKVGALSYDGTTGEMTAPWPETTGCDQLSFNPSLSGQPTTTETDSPSGLETDLSVPQLLSPNTPSPSEIRALTVNLPPGLTINANAADGKTACSEAQAHLGLFASIEEAHCPEYSRVGSALLESSALPAALPGSIYLAEPKPGNPFRIFVTADGFATHVKLAGNVKPDPKTGQLTVSFPELPQSPLTEINLHFFGSEGSLLATPTRCETYAVNSTFLPWDGTLAEQSATQLFSLDSGPAGTACPGATRPLKPGFKGGPPDNTAGAHVPFALELTRNDGEQDLSSLTVTTPPGVLATLAGVPYCADHALEAAARPTHSGLAEEANPSCSVASQIGTARTGAGAGTHPVYLPGNVYLAGPYKGAPLSLAVVTPVVSGPYDFGNVVLRAALMINPETAQITVVSDPLPQIVEGIPLRLRQIMIELNRPNFTLNPTNCDPFSINATASGEEGAQANLSFPFQVAECGVLPFAPKLTLRTSGATKHTGTPALTATLTTRPGEANVARTSVTLPHSEFLDNAHLKTPCTRVQFEEGATPGERCPPGSDIGFARAETPLLGKPLEGPVYLRTSGRKLPDIVAALNGQIDIALDGHVSSVHERLRTTFETVPDAPVSKFTLNLDGGSKGLVENSTNLCSATEYVKMQIAGQNGKTADQNGVLQTPCASKGKKRKQARHLRMRNDNIRGRR